MADVFKKKKFTNIGNIMPTVVDKLGLDRHFNQRAFLDLWPTVVDKVLAEHSTPLYIDRQAVLLVAVKDSSTAQELSFIKTKLLKNLKELGKPLGIKVENIRFDLKQYHNTQQEPVQCKQSNYKKIEIAVSELQELILSRSEYDEVENFKEEIKAVIDEKSFKNEQDDAFCQRLSNLIEKRIRLKKWHKSQNLPFCKQCREPIFQKGVLLCHYCVQEKQTQPQRRVAE